jgi:type 1 glutamine amidotransferase
MPLPPIKTLLFTKTSAYRHTSIPALISGVESLYSSSPSSLTATEDSSLLSSHLPNVELLILGDNSGDFLSGPGEKDALKQFVARGGAIVGIHACTAGEKEWTWYGDTLGGVFTGHPEPQWATVNIHDPTHFIINNLAPPLPARGPAGSPPCPATLSTGASPTSFPWFDEWYNFKSPNAANSTRRDLVTVRDASYVGGTAGDYHPLVWTQEVGDKSSRMFYTALGHFDEAFSDPWFMEMLERGIYWAAGREENFGRGG